MQLVVERVHELSREECTAQTVSLEGDQVALEAQATAQKGKTESHKQSVRSTVWIGCE
jgi:hypothetical protein